jgi:hypothetical protein
MANRMLGVCTKTFSKSGVYFIPAGIGSPVLLDRAVFDSAHVQIDPQTNAPVSSENPILGVRLSDLPNKPISTDIIRVVDGVTTTDYRIGDVQPDGVAGALLFLRRKP